MRLVGPVQASALGNATILLALAVFIALLLPVGLHGDDIAIVSAAAQGGYGELWTSPFLGLFYRPLVVTLVKGSLDLFGEVALPMRILQAVLIATTVALAVDILRDRVAGLGRATGALCLLGSPFVFVGITPFAVGVADLLVGVMLLLAVRVTRRAPGLGPATIAQLLALSVVAVLCKESGLLVAAYGFLVCIAHRRWAPSLAFVAVALAFIGLRAALVEPRQFAFRTGYFGEMYSPAELRAEFGESPLRLYAYSVVGNLLSVLAWVPDSGQLHVPAAEIPLVLLMLATSAAVGHHLLREGTLRFHGPVLALVPMNACLGYMYVRPRVMYVAHMVIALMLAEAVDDLWRRPRRVCGVPSRGLAVALLLGWLGGLVGALFRLTRQGAAQ